MKPLDRYFPVQLADGSTHVLDSRTEQVVETVFRNPDLVERWKAAKRISDRLNRHHREQSRKRDRAAIGCLSLSAVILAVDWAAGLPLSGAIVRAISSAL